MNQIIAKPQLRAARAEQARIEERKRRALLSSVLVGRTETPTPETLDAFTKGFNTAWYAALEWVREGRPMP